jgi:hypothetical protein
MTTELWFVTTILPIAVGLAGCAFYLWHKTWLEREIERERSRH